MEIFEKINTLEILSVLDKAGIQYKKDSGQPHTYTVLKQDGKPDNSFKISTSKNIATDFGGDGVKGGPFDIVGRLVLNVDTQSTMGRANTVKWFIDNGLVEAPDNTKEFKKSFSSEELLKNFDSLRLGGYKAEIAPFLMKRGFNSDWIAKNKLHIGEVFADIGYYDNYFTTEQETWKDEEGKWKNAVGDEPKSVGVFMFPCYDDQANLIGLKLRRKDGKTIRGKKSYAIGRVGLLYTEMNDAISYIVEGEMDWLVLKLLGYDSVIGNLGGVQANRQMLKSLLYDTQKVICLYDNDMAGQAAKKALTEYMNRAVFEIVFPIREDSKGKQLSDVNDYFKAGYDTKTKWDKILKETKLIGEEQDKKSKTDFVFLRKFLEYYDTKFKRIQPTSSVAAYMGLTNKELFKMVDDNTIHSYEDLCYYAGGKPGFYNTLDETTILTNPGDAEPKLHPHIEYLMDNVAGHRKRNSDWLHKAILYKLTHLNDPYVPATVLYGSGGSGKGTFLNLLSKIFGEENTQIGLGQKDLESNFDSYQGGKLIVEFKEVSSGNKHNDKKILDRIKSFIGESKISVNAKFQNARQIDNIAWFHLSSNHAVPIQLDSKHSGNRRFTIIKTGNALDTKKAEEMNQITFNDRQIIREYIAWLYKTFPEIPDATVMPALENEEKKNLEEACEGSAVKFFEWFEERYPHIIRITNPEKNKLLGMYCLEEGLDIHDPAFKQSNFDLGLSHRYEKKKVKIRGATARGYYIRKTKFEMDNMPEGKNHEFTEGELDNIVTGI